MKRTAIVAWAVAGLWVGWAQAKAITPHSALQPSADAPVEIAAEKMEVDQKTGWATAISNVVIRTGDYEMKADRIRLNQETGDVQARGNVAISRRTMGTWMGDYIEFNYKTGKGLTGSGYFHSGVFTVRTHEVTRREDGLYDAPHAVVTTCTNAPGHEHWCMTGQVRYKDNDYIEFYDAVPWLFGVPFAYLPYWYRDIDTHYGFRLLPGYTSRWGAYVLGVYVFNLYESPHEAGPTLDSATHLDYRTKRGVGVGEDFAWNLKDNLGRGKLETYYAWDQDYPHNSRDVNWRSPVDPERYRLRLRHEADITPRDQFILQGTYCSDSEVSHDFFDRQNRGESVPMNFASLEHRENTVATGVEVSGPLNDFFGGVARLPEGWLSVEPQPVLGTGLNYESQTRAGYLDRRATYYAEATPDFMYYPGEWADYNIGRVDTAHRLTYPMKFADVLSVVPRAGYRCTYYSDAEYNSDVYRQTAELGAEVSTRATADWDNGIRHVVEPYLDYSYQPTSYGSDNGRVYGFDHYDRSIEWLDQFGFDGTWLPYDWHGVRPGVRNLFQERDEKNRMRTFLDVDVYAGIQFDSGGPYDEEGVRLMGSKIVYSPNKKLDIKAQGEWDNEANTMAYADLSAFYKLTEKFRLGGGYLARDHALYDYDVSVVDQWNYMKDNVGYGGFTHDINDTWSWSTYVRYDLRNNDLEEVGGYLQYNLDCLCFQLRSAYLNSFERIDGTERKDDFRVGFMVWLRAEKRSPVDDWLTW